MSGSRRRRSYWVYEVAILAIALVVGWRYGLAAYVAVFMVSLLAFSQGLDRGSDIARDAWETTVRRVLR